VPDQVCPIHALAVEPGPDAARRAVGADDAMGLLQRSGAVACPAIKEDDDTIAAGRSHADAGAADCACVATIDRDLSSRMPSQAAHTMVNMFAARPKTPGAKFSAPARMVT